MKKTVAEAEDEVRDVMSDDVRRTLERFQGGYTCSVAIASVFGPRYGAEEDMLCRLANGFAGGIGGLGETCGAVAGAVMILGLRHVPEDHLDKPGRQSSWEIVRRFMADFELEAGSTLCADLLQHDLSSLEGVLAARKAGAFERVCPHLVQTAARLLEKYLEPGQGS